MEEFFKQFLSVMTGGTIYNIIILVFAIVGIGVSYYLYNKSKSLTSVAYVIRMIQLISSGKQKLSEINISKRDDAPVADRSISKIAIWNDGIDTINYANIACNNSLRIEVDGQCEILGVIYGFVGYRIVKRRVPKGFDIFNEEF